MPLREVIATYTKIGDPLRMRSHEICARTVAWVIALVTLGACGEPPPPVEEPAFEDVLFQRAGQGDPQALEWLLAAAEYGRADIQHHLAQTYLDGVGVHGDSAAAIRWLARAAAQGHPESLELLLAVAEAGDPQVRYRLALMYQRGEGVAASDSVAVEMLQAAAALGHTQARYDLGVLHLSGEGVPRSDSAAASWFRAAAEAGNPGAQDRLGLMYLRGEGVARSEAEALRWFRAAASQGHAGAQSHLGQAHATGWGVRPNPAEAVRWFRLAAEQGEVTAQYNLGYLYDLGLGTPRNLGESVRWIRAAAEQGYAEAQYYLATEYMQSDPVSRYAWLFLAGEQGHEAARQVLDDLHPSMTADEVRRALEISVELLAAAAGAS